MKLKVTFLGGPRIPNAKDTWEGSFKAARPSKKFHGKKLGFLILEPVKGKFILTPELKEYRELRERLEYKYHIRGIELTLL